MTAPDEESGAALVDHLGSLGLSEYEARTLIALTRLGTGTAKEVADADSVPRTRVYEAVEGLHEMGLVDIQYSTPRKFSAVSRETIVRRLDVRRENTIGAVSEHLADLGPAEPQSEQGGVWTVSDRGAVSDRVMEFVDAADEQIVYMTVDELLTDEQIAHLAAAEDRGVEIYIAGISEEVQGRIQEEVPSATVFETLWAWAETPAGSLLVTDEENALVSVRERGRGTDQPAETAIWGSGERNSLVVVLRAIFTWRLDGAGASDATGA